MQLLTIGINHHTAPVALRERVAFPLEQIKPALDTFKNIWLGRTARTEPEAEPEAEAEPAAGAATGSGTEAGVEQAGAAEDAGVAGTPIDTVFPFGPKTQVPVSTGES